MSAMYTILLTVSLISQTSVSGQVVLSQLTNPKDLTNKKVYDMIDFINGTESVVVIFTTEGIWNAAISLLDGEIKKELRKNLLDQTKQKEFAEILAENGLVLKSNESSEENSDTDISICYEKLKVPPASDKILQVAAGSIVVLCMADTTYTFESFLLLPANTNVNSASVFQKGECSQSFVLKNSSENDKPKLGTQNQPEINPVLRLHQAEEEIKQAEENLKRVEEELVLLRERKEKVHEIANNAEATAENTKQSKTEYGTIVDESWKLESLWNKLSNMREKYVLALKAYSKADKSGVKIKQATAQCDKIRKELAELEKDFSKQRGIFKQIHLKASNITEIMIANIAWVKNSEARNAFDVKVLEKIYRQAILETKKIELEVSRARDQLEKTETLELQAEAKSKLINAESKLEQANQVEEQAYQELYELKETYVTEKIKAIKCAQSDIQKQKILIATKEMELKTLRNLIPDLETKLEAKKQELVKLKKKIRKVKNKQQFDKLAVSAQINALKADQNKINEMKGKLQNCEKYLMFAHDKLHRLKMVLIVAKTENVGVIEAALEKIKKAYQYEIDIKTKLSKEKSNSQ